MTRWTTALALTATLALAPGCLVTDIKTPLDTNLDKTELGTKVGKSKLKSVLWLVAWGDAGTEAAAKDGEITVLRHADREIFSILFGLWYTQTTVVYGD